MLKYIRKHLQSNRGDANVSKMTIIAIVFVVGAILLIMTTSAFRNPINRWFGKVTAGWFADENGEFAYSPFEQKTYYGDINMDGIVDENDAELLQRWYMGGTNFTDEQIDRMDVNGDGHTDAKDLTHLRRYLDGWEGYELPASPAA